MSNSSTNNSYPSATEPIAEVFGFNKPKSTQNHGDSHESVSHEEHTETAHMSSTPPAPAGLPIAETHTEIHKEDTVKSKVSDNKTPIQKKIEQSHKEVKTTTASNADSHSTATHDVQVSSGSSVWKRAAKTAIPYVLIFAAALLSYFYFFNKVDFGKLFSSTPKTASVLGAKDNKLQQLEKDNMKEYTTWINTFYYDVSDQNVLDPNGDNSGNGLSNFQKFMLNLNPKSYSTLGVGKADSELLAEGINPLSGDKLTDKQAEIVGKYFDMEVIMNRLAATRLKQGQQVAGATTTYNIGGALSPRGPLDGNVIQQQSTYVNTIPTPNVPNNEVDINFDIPGRLEIPALGVNAPLMWTKDPKDFDKELKSGVVHYPGTAVPGQIGTTYISGHSSNYVWVKSDYNHVFTKLDELPDYASFTITVVQKNGSDAKFHYVVKHRKEYAPNDQEQFRNSGKSEVALSTCWPVGTTKNRLVVYGELTQVEK